MRNCGREKSCPKVECTCFGQAVPDGRASKRNLPTIHKMQTKVRRLGVKCSFSENCSFVCATRTSLKSHLKSVHGFNIVEKKLHFQERSDFEKWKEEEERRTCASYVTDTGAKQRKDKKIFYLRCHRSGASRAELNEKKERLRSKPVRGYTQCGSTCPSSMQVVENENGNIDVNYFPNHLGHKIDDESVKYMKLRRKEREEIAAKLAEGETVSKIIREARVNRNEELSRINFLQRRDVYNIKCKVNFLEKEMDEDGKRLDFWISELDLACCQENPIALYKPMDENKDYMLILIHRAQNLIFSSLFDGSIVYVKTKKGKANVDFNMTGVYVVNENGDGYPVGFCISRKSDYRTILSFFKVMFDKMGKITSEIFVSENMNYYYLAWKRVMGEVSRKLICNLNIDSEWDVRLSEWKCPFEKHHIVSQKLKSLLRETDRGIFELELMRALNCWSGDEDLKSFVNYFYKTYCTKTYEWADCYRIDSLRNENINSYLEPLNIQMGEVYGDGGKNIVDALHSMLVLIREECYLSLMKRDGDILQEKVKETEKIHSDSNGITDITFDGNNWIIRHLDMDFNVKKGESVCAKTCNVLCDNCDICLHSFNCCCNDYVINFNICIHIHALVRWNSSKEMNIQHRPEENYLSSMALKFSAVSLSKSITEYLERSEMRDFEYDKIILDLDNFIREHSLKERFEESFLRGNVSTSL